MDQLSTLCTQKQEVNVLHVHAKNFKDIGRFKLESFDSATGKLSYNTKIKIVQHNINILSHHSVNVCRK